jgi:hypothetical protein
MELVWLLRSQLVGTLWCYEGDWIEVGDRKSAERIHRDRGAMAVSCLKDALQELATADEPRSRDIIRFVFCFLFGLPLEARQHYGTCGLREYGELLMGKYLTIKDVLIGTRVYPAGSWLTDAEVGNRLEALLKSVLCDEEEATLAAEDNGMTVETLVSELQRGNKVCEWV